MAMNAGWVHGQTLTVPMAIPHEALQQDISSSHQVESH